jgi:hypothetical protein
MEFEVCQNSLYATHIGRSPEGKAAVQGLRVQWYRDVNFLKKGESLMRIRTRPREKWSRSRNSLKR